MKSNQKLFVLFWLKKSKATTDGTAPVYARITIDGITDEISTGLKLRSTIGIPELKQCSNLGQKQKQPIKKSGKSNTTLNGTFLLLQEQHECVTPQMLKISFTGITIK